LLAEDARPAATLAEAYERCRRIALGHYENFPVVSWLLPQDVRPHIFALYAYCRGVDDLGDESMGDRMILLEEWEQELHRAYDGAPSSDPRFIALAHTIQRFQLPREPFERLIEANRRDQYMTRYETFDQLLAYCSYSANPVGRLVLRIFGYEDLEMDKLSDATCTALQLANFWQDVARDYHGNGRIYIPREDMRKYGVSEDDIASSNVTLASRRLIRFEVRRTRKLFARGLSLIDRVDGKFRLDLRLFTLGGLAVLDSIEDHRYDVLTSRPRVSSTRKAWLALRGLAPVRVRVVR
jgi:squalene synthase HpnC